jgi:hypothetical protein
MRQGYEFPNKLHGTIKCKYITRARIEILKSKDSGLAFYGGLVTCGSVWSCPVCSAKVQERRRIEIAAAIDWAYAEGLQPVMVTFTFPHTQWDDVSDLLDKLGFALKKLRTGEPWKRFKNFSGYEGVIRSLELTIGSSGWHPHTHELWFVSRTLLADNTDSELAKYAKNHKVNADDVGLFLDKPTMKAVILKRWESACRRAGLLPDSKIKAFLEHAVDVKGFCSASEYLAKHDQSKHWGADREIAKATSKRGRGDPDSMKGIHPFGLLLKAGDGDAQAGQKFVEYSLSVRGRAQLYWSRGLKGRVGIVDKTDEEVVEEKTEDADVLSAVEHHEWVVIRAAGKQVALLEAAESVGIAAVRTLIKSLQAAEGLDSVVDVYRHQRFRPYENLDAENKGFQMSNSRKRRPDFVTSSTLEPS